MNKIALQCKEENKWEDMRSGEDNEKRREDMINNASSSKQECRVVVKDIKGKIKEVLFSKE